MFNCTNSRSSCVSTHQKDLSKPLIIQACLRHPCIQAPREMWLCFAGFEPAIYCLKWDMCPSYPDSTWQTGQDDVPPHHPTIAVFIVSPALLQPKSWHAQSSIYENSAPKFEVSRSSRMYPSFASSYQLILIHLTSIPKNCLPALCAMLCFLRRV